MSTKTTFKRIALVAVVALGLGGLSTVPASAAEATPANIVLAKTSESPTGTALAAGKYTADKLLNANGISAMTVTAGKTVTLKAIPVGGASQAGAKYRIALNSAILATSSALGANGTDGTAETAVAFTAPSIAATYAATLVYDEDADFSTTGDQRVASFSLTVSAADALSTATSTAYSVLGNGTAAGDATSTLVPLAGSKSLAATNIGAVTVSLNDAAGTAMASGNTVTVTVTGPGYVSWSTANTPSASQCSATPSFGAAIGKYISAQSADAVGTLYICADGTSGVSTIKIEITDAAGTKQVLATKTVTFYGSIAKLAVTTTNFTIGYAGGAATGAADSTRTATGEVTNAGALTTGTTTPAFIVTTTDSSGVAAGVTVPTIVSSNTAVIAAGTCAKDDGSSATYSSSTNGIGVFNCNFTSSPSAKSGDKATLTVRTPDPASTTGGYLTATLDVTIGGDPYKETLSFDKTAYAPGEQMVISRTAVDSAGNPVADGSSAPSVVFNKATGGSTSVAAGFYVAGKAATSSTKPTIFAPTVGGAFEGRMTGYNSSTTSSQITGTSTVVGDAAADAANAATDAANQATDAANAATDAALAAADAADAATAAAQDASDAVAALSASVEKLVASLKAQITSLTNLVIKIQKKVKA